MTAAPRDTLPIVEMARAKINLTLEIAGRRPDGFHELASLVAFADLGDSLELSHQPEWRLACQGPTASGIAGGNSVDAAARTVAANWADAATGHAQLTKVLPVAAGIGGGSADAAACLRALRRLNAARTGAPDWMRLAQGLGADVPVCLVNRLAFMQGIGERVTALALAVNLPTVLVNPAVPLSTARVFETLAASALPADYINAPVPLLVTQANVLDWAAKRGNDLEAAALRLAPIIADVQAALRAHPGCHLARLSGSGPTCFGLFETTAAAEAAADAITLRHPDWWVRATSLS